MHWWIHEYIWAQEESLAAKLKAQELADTKSSILSKQEIRTSHNGVEDIQTSSETDGESNVSDELTSFVEYDLSTVMKYVIPVDGPHQITCNGQSGGDFAWDDYGLKVQFPPNCSQHFIELSMTAYLPIKSEVFPGLHIVSTDIQFHCNIKKFDKPVTLYLQHCVKLQSQEDCQNMCFVMHKNNEPNILEGKFEIDESYGAVTTSDFCHMHVATRKRKHSQSHISKKSKICKQANDSFPVIKYEEMFVLPKDRSTVTKDWNGSYSVYNQHNGWRSISKRAISTEHKQDFPVEIYTSQVKFDSDGVATLKSENKTHDTWAVGFVPEQIKKEDVDQKLHLYQKEARADPTYGTNHSPKLISKAFIYVTKIEQTATIPLNCFATIDGIIQTENEKNEYREVEILANCERYRRLIFQDAPSSDTRCTPTPVVDGAVAIDQIKDKNNTPTMRDLNRYVTKKYATMWRDVGLELKLERSVLVTIALDNPKDSVNCFEEVLDKWLRLTPSATWKELEIALTNANRMQLGLDPVDNLCGPSNL